MTAARPIRNVRYGASRFGGTHGFSHGIFTALLLFLVAVAGISWVSAGIVKREQWPIRWLELNGSFQRVSAEQMRASLTPLIGSSFFTIDLDAIRQAARRNPWVSHVRVEKRWPDTVTVTIEEFAPQAHWNSGQLISADGVVFSVPEADGIQGLPWLSGPEDRLHDVLGEWMRFNALLESAAQEIERLALNQRGSWSMQLTSGTQVQLGRDMPGERLQRLMTTWKALMSNHELPPVLVDLRYTNGFAVNWPQKAENFVVNDEN